MKIVTLGEYLLRLSTPKNRRFVHLPRFEVTYGGGAANVATSCANYGHEAYFVSKLPKHEIGDSAINTLRRFGVNTDHIVRGGERVGIYFLELGASLRPSKVIYDRAGSAIAQATAAEFDFDAIMEGMTWFHWSGIMPALSSTTPEIVQRACEAAKRHGVMVSLDFNFRSKLWSRAQAREVMMPLMKYVDLCIIGKDDAIECLDIEVDLERDGIEVVFRELVREYGFKYVVATHRDTQSACHNKWSAMIYDGKEFYTSKQYKLKPIIDRVGGGDSFAGALIHGLSTMTNQRDALEFAVAASALKHTIHGDTNHVSTEEVETLAAGDASGRVQR